MRTLGRPNREQVVTTRPSELTTLEALELSNGQPLAELLLRGAEQLLQSHQGESAKVICRKAFAAALSREPTDDELARLEEMMGDSVTADSLADALWCAAGTRRSSYAPASPSGGRCRTSSCARRA